MAFLQDPTLIVEWLRQLLLGWGLSPALTSLALYVLGALALATGPLLWVIFLIWFERKAVARIQDRLGPNRVGKYGLLQPFADVLKLLTKEDIIPAKADKFLYWMAPILSLAGVLLLWPAVPLGKGIGGNVNVAVLYLVAVGTLSTFAILVAGWSANNKYALLGAFRTVAQMISYEVPIVLALLVPVLLARSMNLQDIVAAQDVWFVVAAPLPALIFFIASIAEVGRTPFDLLEAESEIIAGFHIEYSGMKFAMFFAGEFLHAFTVGVLGAVLFFGGWRGPGAEAYPILGLFYLWLKAFLLYFVIVWVRGTFPRVRIDHLLDFTWKFLTPLALVVLMATAVLDKTLVRAGAWPRALGLLVVNAVIWLLAQRWLRKVEKRLEPPMVAQPGQYPVARYTPPEPQAAEGD